MTPPTSNTPTGITLQQALVAGSIIAGNSILLKPKPTDTLPQILRERLLRYDEVVQRLGGPQGMALEEKDLVELELMTANESLWIVVCVHNMCMSPGEVSATNLLTAMDIMQMRLLISLAIKWGTEILLRRLLPTLPNKRHPNVPPGAAYVDLSCASYDYSHLISMLFGFCNIISFEKDTPFRSLAGTPIVAIILSAHLADILRPLICIGWMPDCQRGELQMYSVYLQPFTHRLLFLYVCVVSVEALLNL